MPSKEVKYDRYRAVYQTNRLATYKAYPVNSNIYDYIRVSLKKKASTGVLPDQKQNGKTLQSITACSAIACCARSQE